MSNFDSLGLDESILRAVRDSGYAQPTPIQAQSIPPLLEQRDVLGCAQTGTGKTAAFVLPVLHRLMDMIPERGGRVPRALILAPTRELAGQIGESIERYAKYLPVRHDVIYGGVSLGPQLERIRRGVDLVVATPGRLLELVDRNAISLKNVEFFILDEADRMLDMGFIRDIRRIITQLPKTRQNLLFSATMPKEIEELASTILHRPVKIEVAPPATTGEKIEQQLFFVEGSGKPKALAALIRRLQITRAIVFTRTKHGANRVVKVLDGEGIPSMAIHGNKSQNHRERALSQFRSGEIPLLIATDIASRGIDVEGVTHVINYDLPDDADAYVHRIGRTGRAGRTGVAIAFCADEERGLLFDVVRLTRQPIDIIDESGEVVGRYEVPGKNDRRPPSPKREQRGQRGGGRQGQGQAGESKPRGQRVLDGESPRPAASRQDRGARPPRDAGRPGAPEPRREGGGPSNANASGRGRGHQPRPPRGEDGAGASRGGRRQGGPRPPQDHSGAARPPQSGASLPSASEGARLRRPRR